MNPLTSSRRIAAVFVLSMAWAGMAQAEGSWFGTRVSGSGRMATEQRNVTGFQAISLKGSMDLVVRQSGKEGVEISADDNILPLIETSVIDRDGVPTLQVTTTRGSSYSTRNNVTVTVDVSTLKALSVSGSGDATADGLRVGDLKVRISGSGDIRLRELSAEALSVSVAGSGDVAATGRASRLAISIAGSGGVVTRELQADDVRVAISGSGDAQVHAQKTLAVSIAGSGDVRYSGDASVKTSIAGSGNVKKL